MMNHIPKDGVIIAANPDQALELIRNMRRRKQLGDPEKIRIRSHISSYNSYGIIGNEIAEEFIRQGVKFEICPINDDHIKNQHGAGNSHEVLKKTTAFVKGDNQFTLLIHPPDYPLHEAHHGLTNFVWYSMWEATRMNPAWVTHLNLATAVIVPCNYCLDVFSACGVRAPMYKVPLGLSEDYKPVILKQSDPFIFGTGGRLSHGGSRKGVGAVVHAFLKAFPDNPDVRLHIKIFNDCKMESFDDPRIVYIREYLQEPDMIKWYQRLNCYVSMAQSEGFGLMPMAALKCGTPLISPIYSGTTEYLHETVCYPVDFKYVETDGHYRNAGHWAAPSIDDCADQMRHVYENYDAAMVKATLGSEALKKYTWANTAAGIRKVCQEVVSSI